MTTPIHPAKSNVLPLHREALRYIADNLDINVIEFRIARPQPTRAERMVNYFRHNGNRIVFGITCFALGSLFTCAAAYVISWTVLS